MKGSADERLASAALYLERYRIAHAIRAKFPTLPVEELLRMCDLPPLWGSPEPGRWFGGDLLAHVYGICDKCGGVYQAIELQLRLKSFTADTIRVCPYCR